MVGYDFRFGKRNDNKTVTFLSNVCDLPDISLICTENCFFVCGLKPFLQLKIPSIFTNCFQAIESLRVVNFICSTRNVTIKFHLKLPKNTLQERRIWKCFLPSAKGHQIFVLINKNDTQDNIQTTNKKFSLLCSTYQNRVVSIYTICFHTEKSRAFLTQYLRVYCDFHNERLLFSQTT